MNGTEVVLGKKTPVSEMKWKASRTDHRETKISGLEDKMEELEYSFKDSNKGFLKWDATCMIFGML